MAFFNSKEEVLDIELTQYGKYLLSRGKFKPSYYAFFDDNILYDSQYADFAESHNSVQDRIFDETAYNRTQYVFSGIESNIKKIKKMATSISSTKLIPVQSQVEKFYTLTAPLGNSSVNVDKKPYLEVYFLEGKISHYETSYTGSHARLPIPQLSASILFKSQIRNAKDKKAPLSPVLTPPASSKILDKTGEVSGRTNDDRVYEKAVVNAQNIVEVRGHEILIDITEFNSEYTNENFEIELFMVQEESLSGSAVTPELSGSQKYKREVLVPLKFGEKFSNIENDLLIEPEAAIKKRALYREPAEENPEFSEYYFDILVDEEIDLCRSLDIIKKRLPNYDIALKCPDRAIEKPNIYGSSVSEEDIEKCQT